MNRFVIVLLGVVFYVTLCFGQSASSVPAQTAPTAVGHGAFPVKLTKALDSSKLKEGEIVEAETAGSFKLADGTLVPKGSKLTGHVTSAKARSKGDADSQLTMAFDKLNVSGGKQISLKGMVQAAFPPAEDEMGPNMATAGTSQGGSGAGGSPGGVGLTNAKSGSDMQASSRPQPVMDPKSMGVQGIHDLDLNDGVLTSKGKSVKLSSGVRLIVHVDIYE